MKKIEKVSIIGLGAIGSSYFEQMSKLLSIENLHIIAGGARAERYRKNGITINGKTYNYPITDPQEPAIAADLVIISVKYGGLVNAIEDIKNHVGPNTIILSLLNGINSENEIAKTYDKNNILYSFVVGISAIREKNHFNNTNLGKIVFGDGLTNTSENVILVKEFLEMVEIPYEIPKDIISKMWWKYMLNVGSNQVLAISRSDYGAVKKGSETRALILDAMQEVVMVAEKEGINLTQADVESAIAVIDNIAPDGKPSTRQDVEAKRKTEVEIFSGELIKLGEKHSLDLPINKVIYRMIKALEEGYL